MVVRTGKWGQPAREGGSALTGGGQTALFWTEMEEATGDVEGNGALQDSATRCKPLCVATVHSYYMHVHVRVHVALAVTAANVCNFARPSKCWKKAPPLFCTVCIGHHWGTRNIVTSSVYCILYVCIRHCWDTSMKWTLGGWQSSIAFNFWHQTNAAGSLDPTLSCHALKKSSWPSSGEDLL